MKNDWTFCDGNGGLSRRQALASLGLGILGVASARSALAQVAVRPPTRVDHTLVVIFLRGGADGLSLVPPAFEDDYYRRRPQLHVPEAVQLKLDGKFAMHPALRPLHEIWEGGELSISHAVGSQDTTRSHFEAMRTMEYGDRDGSRGVGGGWLGRYLNATNGGGSPLRAVAMGGMLPDSLRGANEGVALESLEHLSLRIPAAAGDEGTWRKRIAALYEGWDPLSQAGRETLKVLDLLASTAAPTETGAYPETPLGRGLRDLAFLIEREVGVEFACLDQGAWDTHVTQGVTEGWIAGQMQDVAQSVAAFWRELGPRRKNVTMVLQTEFGRRVEENQGLGTDHGRASVMMVLDAKANGREVRGQWPGLKDEDLDEVGDLKVGTDYRQILAEILAKRFDPTALSKVFPGETLKPVQMLA